MEEPLPNQGPQVFREEGRLQVLSRLFESPWRLPILAVLVLGLLVGSVFFLIKPPTKPSLKVPLAPGPKVTTLQDALTTAGKFPQEEKIAKVGSETLYGRDLNYFLFLNFPKEFQDKAPISSKIRETALKQLIDDSVLLQSSQKMGLVELSPSIFNNLDKNYSLRAKTLYETRQKLAGLQDLISGARISIWVYNVRPPKIPLEEAEKMAKEKMEKLRADLIAKKITLEEAGKIIAADSSLAQIDFNYKGNAYSTFKDKSRADSIFLAKEWDKIAWSLEEGEISPLLRSPSQPSPTHDQQFYSLIGVTKRQKGEIINFVDWVKGERGKYVIEKF